jgi:cell division protein FtsI (penicillin-binding protein 3)
VGSNSEPNKKKSNGLVKRLVTVALVISFCFALLIIQFYRIQIVDEDYWSRKAERQHYFTISEPFRRGVFYSNTSLQSHQEEKKQPFVVDIKKYHLYIDPASIDEQYRDEVSGFLVGYLEVSGKETVKMRQQFNRKSRSRRLQSWLSQTQKDEIVAWWKPYARAHKIAGNAIYFVSDYQRSYPYGNLLGQVLHTIQDRKDEISKQAVPTGGLEYYFHRYLKGSLGKRRMMRSPRHSFDTGDVIVEPNHGCDIYLTINHVLQAICEEEIEKGVKKVRGKSGWAVIMQPRTGEILALAQYPFFHPPDYQKYYNDKTLMEHSRVKAATDANEPASVSKAFTVAVALLANLELQKRGEPVLFDPEEKMATADGAFPGRSRPIKDTRLHQYMNMDMAIQKSSNIYVARLMQRVVERLGKEWYRNTLIDTFGLGKKTGIELPSESAGVLPKPGRLHPNGKLEWSVPTPFSLAIGHNYQANSFQILRAFSIFANGGYLVQPTLVRKVIRSHADGHEEVLIDHTSEEWTKQFQKVLPNRIVDRVVQSIKYVTKPGGGGWRGDVWGYTEAGKTGTAKKIVNGQYSNSSYCASFIGFAPVKDPEMVVMIVIDEPDTSYRQGVGHSYYGSVAAAPVFKTITKRALEYLGVPSDDPFGYASNDPRYDESRADWKNETKSLTDKYNEWNR